MYITHSTVLKDVCLHLLCQLVSQIEINIYSLFSILNALDVFY